MIPGTTGTLSPRHVLLADRIHELLLTATRPQCVTDLQSQLGPPWNFVTVHTACTLLTKQGRADTKMLNGRLHFFVRETVAPDEVLRQLGLRQGIEFSWICRGVTHALQGKIRGVKRTVSMALPFSVKPENASAEMVRALAFRVVAELRTKNHPKTPEKTTKRSVDPTILPDNGISPELLRDLHRAHRAHKKGVT